LTKPPRPVRTKQERKGANAHTMWAKRTQDEVTNPSARNRQEKAPRRPAVLWPNEPERPPTSDWVEMADWAERTQRPRHARSQSLLPLGSIHLLAFRLKILLYFSCCLQGSLFLRSLWLCRSQPSKGPIRRKSRRSERTRGAKLTRQPGYFGRTNPRRQPGQHLAKRSQGAARSRLWPNKPKLRTSPRLRQTNPTTNRANRVSAK
jgi:hypothetical protein